MKKQQKHTMTAKRTQAVTKQLQEVEDNDVMVNFKEILFLLSVSWSYFLIKLFILRE